MDMPLNAIPPTTTVPHLKAKQAAAQNQCYVDVGLYGGVVPDNVQDIKPLMDQGVKGFKCFLIESGVDEFPYVEESHVHAAMKEFEGTDAVFMFHAEVDIPLNSSEVDKQAYGTFLHSRPQQMEVKAAELVIRALEQHPSVHGHIVHLSAAAALDTLRAAKQRLNLTVETCFHYLTLESEHVPHGATLYKCCPPIRTRDNRDKLWEGLRDGVIDFIVSDHSPCTRDLKCMDTGDFMCAWGGIGGLGLGLGVLWNEASRRGFSVQDVARWCCERPAKHARVDKTKGTLAVGMWADLCIWDPTATYTARTLALFDGCRLHSPTFISKTSSRLI